MPYADETAFAARFGQVELDQATATNGGLTYDDAAADADDTIDSYLAAVPGRLFTLPLTSPPARIVGVAADLTRYELWANRASEEIIRRRDQAIEFLKDLVAGKAILNIDVTTPPETVADPGKRLGFRTNGRVFTDRTLAGFVRPGCDLDDPAGGLRGCD